MNTQIIIDNLQFSNSGLYSDSRLIQTITRNSFFLKRQHFNVFRELLKSVVVSKKLCPLPSTMIYTLQLVGVGISRAVLVL